MVLDTEAFSAVDFDASAFIQKARRRTALSELQKQLDAHSGQVKGELKQLLNDKFADFVSLANRMQFVDRTAAPLWAPLQQQHAQALAFKAQLDGVLDQAQRTREERRGIVAAKRRLETYITGVRALDEIKAVRLRLDAGPKLDFLQRHTAFECMARSLQRLEADVESYRDCDIFRPLICSLEEIKGDFTIFLLQSLEEALVAFQKQWKAHGVPASESVANTPYAQSALALAYLVRDLQTLKLSEKVTRKFHDVFVGQILENVNHEEMKRAGQKGLSAFFAQVRTLLHNDSLFLYITQLMCLPSNDTLAYGVPGLELCSTAVGVPVIEHMLTHCPSVFMPSVPDAFVRNYRECMSFFDSLERAMDECERRRWRNRTVLVDFKNKWKTLMYCAVRQKEISQKFDAALSTPAEIGESFQFIDKKFAFQASQDLWILLQYQWSADVYLPTLFHKFFHLSFTMLSKYFDHMRNLAQTLSGKGLAMAICDIFTSKGLILTTLRELSASHGLDRIHSTVLACIEEIAADGQRLGLELGDTLRVSAMEQVSRELRAIKGIPPLYRMTARPSPTEASAYVDATLQALMSFQCHVQMLPEGMSDAWMQGCVEEAHKALTTEVSTMLEGLEQQEKSLQKLRGAASAQRAGIPPNIFKQLQIDIDSFRMGCQNSFGIKLPKVEIPLLERE